MKKSTLIGAINMSILDNNYFIRTNFLVLTLLLD